MQTAALSVSLVAIKNSRRDSWTATESRIPNNVVVSFRVCVLWIHSFIKTSWRSYFLWNQGSIIVFLQTCFIGKWFVLDVHDQSVSSDTWSLQPLCLFTLPLCVFSCVIFRHRPALWHMLLTVSLCLETAALVTLRHSHSFTRTDTHTLVLFFNLGEQQLISHSCATPPITAPLVPCGARRRKRRVFGSTLWRFLTLTLSLGILHPHGFGFRDGWYGRMSERAGSAGLRLRCQQAGQVWEFMLKLFF